MSSEIILYQAKVMLFQVDYVSIPNSSIISFFISISASYKFKIVKYIVNITKRQQQIA